MSRDLAGDYISSLREVIGTRRLLVVATAAIISDSENHILLQHRSDTDDWCAPGGLMDLGETVSDCVRREIAEETTLELGEVGLFGIYSGTRYFGTYPNGDQIASVIIVFACSDWTGTPERSVESHELCWFGRGELPPNVNPHHVEYLTDYWRDTARIL